MGQFERQWIFIWRTTCHGSVLDGQCRRDAIRHFYEEVKKQEKEENEMEEMEEASQGECTTCVGQQ